MIFGMHVGQIVQSCSSSIGRRPWQASERDVARLLLANGFEDVRIVGGSGDHGGDVLGVRSGELWVWQCKHTTTGPPPSRDAVRLFLLPDWERLLSLPKTIVIAEVVADLIRDQALERTRQNVA